VDEESVLVINDARAMFWVSFFLKTTDFTPLARNTSEGRPETTAGLRLLDSLAMTIGHYL